MKRFQDRTQASPPSPVKHPPPRSPSLGSLSWDLARLNMMDDGSDDDDDQRRGREEKRGPGGGNKGEGRKREEGRGVERSDALPRQRCECSMRRERTNIFFAVRPRGSQSFSPPTNEKPESGKQFLPPTLVKPINWRGGT
ncbi:hypothetical protein L873DRAFT_656464 [Choiromyces venosus 120613-1]|uniref:Uncharacterized protein n=1 Tax=Choiromyces venosus 120613-1 TaxID=1336337 RepID=A0A3N4JWN7_9PEZI|nr:hypothetical protein L873DRAFT_656464 [Choiromyces venosus 120613-1]